MYYKVTVFIDDKVKGKMGVKYPDASLGDAVAESLKKIYNPERKKAPAKRPVGRPRKIRTELYPGIRKREAIQKAIYDALLHGPVPTEKLIEKVTTSLGITERSVTYVMAHHIPAIKHGNHFLTGKKVWCSWLNKP